MAMGLESGYSKFNVKPKGFKPAWIVVHHSFSTDAATTRNWDSIKKYHMSYRYKGETVAQERFKELQDAGMKDGLETPWKDIGYNFGVELVDGKLMILEGRAIGEVGAHAHGFNANSIGICMVGNYDIDPPCDDRMFTLASLCRDLQREFQIRRENVIGHRDTYRLLNTPVLKTCPGSKFDLDALRARLIDV
jgi:N-acetyl-anhydromuramyl-L-alanine amidase AmpD